MPDQGWKGRDSLSSLAVWDCTPSWREGMSGWLATFHLHRVLKAQPAVPFPCSPEPMWWCSHIQDRSFLSNSSWKTFIDQMCVSMVILGWPSWQWRVTVVDGIYSIVGLCVLIFISRDCAECTYPNSWGTSVYNQLRKLTLSTKHVKHVHKIPVETIRSSPSEHITYDTRAVEHCVVIAQHVGLSNT